jgi:hypothetical protein
MPAGWSDSTLLYLRTFADGSSRAELHGSEWNGEGDYVVWEGELDGILARPVATSNGVWVLTQSGWLQIGMDGSSGGPVENPWGQIGEPTASPFGSLFAFDVGGQVVVVSAQDPSVPYMPPIPSSGGGFAFAPSGEQFVVADGSGLAIYDLSGTLVGHADGAAVSTPGWSDGGIYFVEQSEGSTLRRITADALFQG